MSRECKIGLVPMNGPLILLAKESYNFDNHNFTGKKQGSAGLRGEDSGLPDPICYSFLEKQSPKLLCKEFC